VLLQRRTVGQVPLRLAGLWRTYRQDGCDRTARPVPAAMRWGAARTLRTASVGLEWGQTCPLMLFQQPPELSIFSSEKSLCVVHLAMVLLTMMPRQPPFAAGLQLRLSQFGAEFEALWRVTLRRLIMRPRCRCDWEACVALRDCLPLARVFEAAPAFIAFGCRRDPSPPRPVRAGRPLPLCTATVRESAASRWRASASCEEACRM
jgi:hypothetical protein